MRSKEIEALAAAVEEDRRAYLNEVQPLTNQQGAWKPEPEAWSAAEITEHLFWAEQWGILFMWKALEGLHNGQLVFAGEMVNKGSSIEEVVARTWRPKEIAPEGARPHVFGPLAYWASALESCQIPLQALANALREEELEKIIYPHVFMGPLNVRQRYEFLRFHLDRHCQQVAALKEKLSFASA